MTAAEASDVSQNGCDACIAALNAAAIKRYRADPVAFVDEVLVNPATGKPYVLLEAEKAFLRQAFQLDKRGKLRFPLLI